MVQLVVALVCSVLAASARAVPGQSGAAPPPPGYAGSSSCRECHERFYELWSTSHHGTAMQPYTPGFARDFLAPQTNWVKIGDYRFKAHVEGKLGWVAEEGPEGDKRYPILHAMGGKNLFYFLTPMEKGKLQVLPVAFDVRTRQWYDTTASMVRHVHVGDEALHWTERPLTFNTACFNCHVSQLSKNYDAKNDSYNTVWAEPGINCETCHGASLEHVKVCKAAGEGKVPEDLKLIKWTALTPAQRDVTCAPCHAKMRPITPDFKPGETYFDHYDLVTLEDNDFYPDARDLGENYTWTLWHMNPCVKAGKLECIHCHTSSGRFRQRGAGDKSNTACLPCHKERVENAVKHTRHEAGTRGNACIACHMPMTVFARMQRSDHSLLPPTPAATIEFKSPNACSICHDDKTPQWADKHARKWFGDDYQEPVLERARLIQAARSNDFTRLEAMLDYVEKPARDPIVAASLVRMFEGCRDSRHWPVLRRVLENDTFPLLRAAAARTLVGNLDDAKTIAALLDATEDSARLVRVRAAGSLARHPRTALGERDRARLKKATEEFRSSIMVWPDDWSSHYNLGNFYVDRGESRRALESFATAARLQPSSVPPLVNAAMVHARLGENSQSEVLLRRALAVDPASPEANFNLGLALAEKRDYAGAETHLRAALKRAPRMAAAAYNLGVLVASRNPGESLDLCRRAASLVPGDPKYAYTYAFYLRQTGKGAEAIGVLERLAARHPDHIDGLMLLAATYEARHDRLKAIRIYRRIWRDMRLPQAYRQRAAARLQVLER